VRWIEQQNREVKGGVVDVGRGRREEVQRALSAAPGRPGIRAEQKEEKREKRLAERRKRECRV
jgi:hypothetical protein